MKLRALLVVLLLCFAAAEARAQCVMATGTFTGAGTGTAVSGGTGCGGAGAGTDYTVPDTVTVTDSGGLAALSAAGSVTVQAGGILITTTSPTVAGELILDGQLVNCVTDAASCVIDGETATNTFPLASWSTYSLTMNANGEEATITGDETTTVFTSDGTWDSAFLDGQIAVFADIDGDPSNDSWAQRSRPFFNVQTNGSDNVTITTEVGRTYAAVAAAHQFKETTTGCTNAATTTANITTGDGGNADADVSGTDAGEEMDDNYANRLDSPYNISLSAGVLPGWKAAAGSSEAMTGELMGMTIILAASSADGRPYTIADSLNGGAGADSITTVEEINSTDLSGSAQTCTVGWGWGTGASNPLFGAREFYTYKPAQLVTTTEASTLTFTGTGGLTGQFGLIGPLENVASQYAPLIVYAKTHTGTARLTNTWHVAGSGDNSATVAASSCGGSAWTIGTSGTVTLERIQVSHPAEEINCGGTGDDSVGVSASNSGFHGIIMSPEPTGTVNVDQYWAFALGDAGLGVKSSAAGDDQTAGTFNISNVHCTWLLGDSSACYTKGLDLHDEGTYSFDGFYAVGVQARAGQCNASGTGLNNGEWCNADADCDDDGAGAHVGVCVEMGNATFHQGLNQLTEAGRVTLKNAVVIAGDAESSIFIGSDEIPALSVDGFWVHDKRVNAAIDADANYPATLSNVWSAKNGYIVAGTGVGTISHDIENTYWRRIRSRSGSTIPPLLLGGDGDHRIVNNFFGDILEDNDNDFLEYSSPPTAGDRLLFAYNYVDRSEVASTDDTLQAIRSDILTGDALSVYGNVVSNYQYILDCNANGVTLTESPNFGFNVQAPSSAATAEQVFIETTGSPTACAPSGTVGRTIKERGLIIPRFLMGRSVSLDFGSEKAGLQRPAGYRQTDWLSSLGFLGSTIGGGKSGSPVCPSAVGGCE